MKGRPSQPLNAAQQFMLLRANPLAAGDGQLKPGQFDWSFDTRPSPLSRNYKIRILFWQDYQPVVYVDSPDLVELAEGRRLPHVYKQQPTQLCLYFPKTGEWRSYMRIDQTLVPWAVLWLFYFEEWLLSDDWKGGGMHPAVPERRLNSTKRPRRRAA